MANTVTSAQIEQARQSDLYEFLARNHPDEFVSEGESLRSCERHSISVKRGYCGFRDFATGETGNSIDFLQHHLHYDFVSAVKALVEFQGSEHTIQDPKISDAATELSSRDKLFSLPARVDGRYTQLYAFLHKTRCIPIPLIDRLVKEEKILYQEKEHNNIVFIDRHRKFGEVQGTLSSVPFHGIVPGSDIDASFCFQTYFGSAKGCNGHIYICETAIDAMSLFTIHVYEKARASTCYELKNNLYVSMAEITNRRSVDRAIKETSNRTDIYLAFNDTEAGRELIDIYNSKDCPVSGFKNWNSKYIHVQPCLPAKYETWNEELIHRLNDGVYDGVAFYLPD